MRKILSGGVLLSLGLFATHAAVEAWMETRAVLALERFARDLPEGAQLVWERLDASPLRLAVEVEGLRLDLPSGGPIHALAAHSVRLAQAVGGVGRSPGPAAVRAGELVVELAEGRGTLRAARVEGEAIDIAALERALAAPDPWEALAAVRLGPLRAAAVTFEGPDRRASVNALALEGLADRELRGLRLDGLELAGPADESLRLEALSIGRLTLAPELVDPLGALSGELEVERVALRGLEVVQGPDRAELAGLALDRLGPGRLDRLRLEGLRLASPDGRTAVERLELERIDWSGVRPERIAQALAVWVAGENGTADPQEPAEAAEDGAADEAIEAEDAEAALARSFAGLELLAEAIRLEIGAVRIERASGFGAQDAGASLELLRWEGLRDRRFGALELAGLDARAEDGTALRLERFEQSALVLAPPEFAHKLEETPRTEEGLQELLALSAALPWENRTLARGFALSKEGRLGFGIERLALVLEQRETVRRTDVELAGLVLDPEVLEDETLQETLASAGIDRLQLAARLSTSVDAGNLAADLDPLVIEAPGFFAVRTAWFGRLGADPTLDPVAAAMGAQLLRAEFVYRDQGLVDRQLERVARETNRSRARLAQDLVRELRGQEPLRSLLDQKRAGELQKFLTTPRTLVVRLEPKAPVAFLGGITGLLATPGQTARTLGLSIEAADR